MSSQGIVQWLESLGQFDARAACLLAALVVGTALLPVPRTIVVLGAGAAFGLNALSVIVPSTTLGCVLAFLLARGLLREWVERQIEKRALWRTVAQAVNDEGWRIVALMRLWGPLPNFAQNYLFGLTNIKLLPYTLITFAFTLPQIVFYAYLGASGRSILLDDGPLPLNRVILAIALVIVVTIVVLVSLRVRAILSQRRIASKA